MESEKFNCCRARDLSRGKSLTCLFHDFPYEKFRFPHEPSPANHWKLPAVVPSSLTFLIFSGGWNILEPPSSNHQWSLLENLPIVQVNFGVHPFFKVSIEDGNITLSEGELGLPNEQLYYYHREHPVSSSAVSCRESLASISAFHFRSSSPTKSWSATFTTAWRPAPTQKQRASLTTFSASRGELWRRWKPRDRRDPWRRFSDCTTWRRALIHFLSTQRSKTCSHRIELTTTRRSKWKILSWSTRSRWWRPRRSRRSSTTSSCGLWCDASCRWCHTRFARRSKTSSANSTAISTTTCRGISVLSWLMNGCDSVSRLSDKILNSLWWVESMTQQVPRPWPWLMLRVSISLLFSSSTGWLNEAKTRWAWRAAFLWGTPEQGPAELQRRLHPHDFHSSARHFPTRDSRCLVDWRKVQWLRQLPLVEHPTAAWNSSECSAQPQLRSGLFPRVHHQRDQLHEECRAALEYWEENPRQLAEG